MILLLAGTREARRLAKALREAGIPAMASLAGTTRQPAPQGLPTRIGGFGGEVAFIRFVEAAGISGVIDATHPFAARITARTARICREIGLPYLRLERAGWSPGPGDRWVMIGDESEAAAHIAPHERVFLATGRQTLERFANLEAAEITCRQIDPPEGEFPLPKGQFLVGRPPFSVEDEVALFRRLRIDVLVVKNAGGRESASKLEAMRVLGRRVLMVHRPAPPEGVEIVRDVDQAIEWAGKV